MPSDQLTGMLGRQERPVNGAIIVVSKTYWHGESWASLEEQLNNNGEGWEKRLYCLPFFLVYELVLEWSSSFTWWQ